MHMCIHITYIYRYIHLSQVVAHNAAPWAVVTVRLGLSCFISDFAGICKSGRSPPGNYGEGQGTGGHDPMLYVT